MIVHIPAALEFAWVAQQRATLVNELAFMRREHHKLSLLHVTALLTCSRHVNPLPMSSKRCDMWVPWARKPRILLCATRADRAQSPLAAAKPKDKDGT